MCPILSEIRKVYFLKNRLSEDEIYDILNGNNWLNLVNYVIEANAYRLNIVNEDF